MDGRIEFYWTIPTYITLIMGFYSHEAHICIGLTSEKECRSEWFDKKKKKTLAFLIFSQPLINL